MSALLIDWCAKINKRNQTNKFFWEKLCFFIDVSFVFPNLLRDVRFLFFCFLSFFLTIGCCASAPFCVQNSHAWQNHCGMNCRVGDSHCAHNMTVVNLIRRCPECWCVWDYFYFAARVVSFLNHLNLNGDAFLQFLHVADNPYMSARFCVQWT